MSDSALPEHVIAAWQRHLARCPKDAAPMVEQAIRTYLPPVALRGLRLAYDWLAIDYPQAVNEAPPPDPGTLFPGGELDEALPSSLATGFPLFYAAWKVFRDDATEDRATRRLLSHWVSALAAPTTKQDPSAYYDDVLALRQALAACRRAGHLAALGPDITLDQVVMILDSWSPRKRSEYKIEHHHRRLKGLAKGSRLPGTRAFRKEKRTPHHLRRLRHRPVQTETSGLEAGLDRARAQKRREAASSSSPGGDPGLAATSFQTAKPSRPSQPAEPHDPDHPTFYVRKKPAVARPSDDVAAGPGMPATAMVPGLTDPQTLPTDLLAATLEALATRPNPVELALAWLGLTTGLPLNRLTKLDSAQGATGAPWWDRANMMLRYELLDGPAPQDPKHGPGNRIVALPIRPPVRAGLLVDAERPPFQSQGSGAQLIRKINDALRRRFGNHPGPTPTLNRILATGRAWRRSRAQDPATAAALSGQFGVSLAAQAAYRRYPARELTELYQHVHNDLRNALLSSPEAGTALTDALAEPAQLAHPNPTHRVGSGRALGPGAYWELLTALREGVEPAVQRATAAGFQTQEGLQAWAEAINWQAAYTYLVFLLATAARPVAKKTVFVPFTESAYLADKASGRYRESRLIPLSPTLKSQLAQATADRQRLTRYAAKGQWRLTPEAPPEREALPMGWRKTRGKAITIAPLTQKWFDALLREWGLAELVHWPANGPRHAMASFLRDRIRPDLIDQLMGHHGAGADPMGPASTRALSDWAPLVDAIETALDRAGVEPLGLWWEQP